MKRILKRGILTIIAFTLSMFFSNEGNSTYANTTNINFKELTIVIMPEYNLHPEKDVKGPNLLIGLHGTVVNESSKPISEIEIPIPVAEKNFVLSLSASPSATNEETIEELKNTINENNHSINIQFKEAIQPAGTAKFMIEYFYTPIEVSEKQKAFEYTYTAIAETDLMNVMVFEPYGSESFTATPASEKQATDSMSVKMHLYEYTNVKAGDEKKYSFSYVKKDDVTTVEKIEQITSEHSEFSEANTETKTADSTNDNSATKQRSYTTEIIVAVALILLLGIAFAIWFVKRNRQKKTSNNIDLETNKKELRKLLAEGKIDEKQYLEELSKLE